MDGEQNERMDKTEVAIVAPSRRKRAEQGTQAPVLQLDAPAKTTEQPEKVLQEQVARSEKQRTLRTGTLVSSRTTKKTVKPTANAKDLVYWAQLHVCLYSTLISCGVFILFTGAILTGTGYSAATYEHFTSSTLKAHRVGGTVLLGLGCSLLALGLVCCVYSLKQTGAPPPYTRRTPRISITGIGSSTTMHGQQGPTPKPRSRRTSCDDDEPEEISGLPPQQVEVDLEHHEI